MAAQKIKLSSPLISEHCFYYLNTFHVHNIVIVCEKLANSAYLLLSSIFSNDCHVFQRIKNPHDRFTNNTLRTNHAKLQTIWLSSFTGEDLQRYNICIERKLLAFRYFSTLLILLAIGISCWQFMEMDKKIANEEQET